MKTNKKLVILVVVAVMGVLLSLGGGLASAGTTVVVSPSNMSGWVFLVETGTGSGAMVLGPDDPPLGRGSANLVVDDAAGGLALLFVGYQGVRLVDIEKLEYSTYRTSGSAPLAISLQFNIDNDLTDGDNGWKGRLVFEPYYTETVLSGTWQTWDPKAGRWWGTRDPIKSACPISAPCTWDQVLNSFPNAGIHRTFGAVLFKAGSGWAGGFDGNVDAFTISVSGVETTYDFDPFPNVAIDIKPGSFPNSINPRSKGVIPVAILTTDSFDATTVDPATVLFGRMGTEAAPVHFAFEDVDGDGDTDLILHFKTQATGIQCGDTSAILTGETLSGQTIEGSDLVTTVGCK